MSLVVYKFKRYCKVFLLFLIVHGDDPLCCRCLKRPVYFDYSDAFLFSLFSCVSEKGSVVAYFPSRDNRNVYIVTSVLLRFVVFVVVVLLPSILLNL